MPQTSLSQFTLTERLAIDGPTKVELVQSALGHPLADDVAHYVAEEDSDPLVYIMLMSLRQPSQDQQEQSEQFFHDRKAGGWR